MNQWLSLCVSVVVGLALSLPSFAADSQVFVGVGGVNNDPFLKRKMVAAGYAYRPQSNLSLNVDLHFSPDLGEADWKPLTNQLIQENHFGPDISKINYAGRVGLTVFPVEYSTVDIQTRVGFGTSIGVVKTSDDLQALDTTEASDDRAVGMQHQMHPCLGFVVTGEVWKDSTGARLRIDHMMYIETANATQLEMKNNRVVMIDVMRKF
jgi:hypothetical protein